MVSYPLDLPAAPALAGITLRRAPVTGMSRSPYTGAQYVVAYAGQWWEADCLLPTMKRPEAAAWRSFFAKLNGSYGTFLLGDPTGQVPRGSAASAPGTPLVKGAGQSGGTLVIDGLPPGAADYLMAGDFIQLGTGLSSRLHMVTDDADVNGSGEATLNLWPNLRASPSDNAAVIVSGAKGLFRLMKSTTEDSARPGPFYDFENFTAIEAL